MAIDIKFDLVGNPEPPTINLATRSGKKLGLLEVDIKSVNLSDKLNDASEFSFTLNKYVDGRITNLWDKVVNFKLVYCKEWDMWFEIKVELDEETETIKTVFCTQLGKSELSQLKLYNIEINTEDDIARDDYKITILYDENDKEASLLDRLLKDKAPHYRVVHVDPTIAKIQRSFSFDDKSIDDAFQEIAKEIGCLFDYPSNSDENGRICRDIYVYDLQQNCSECGYRGEFTDTCPKCKSTNIENGYGEDTLIFVTSDELAASGIQLTTDTDSVKNCFKLEAGDDLMTATIRNCNPNGTDYIWYRPSWQNDDMSDELLNKIKSYDDTYKNYYNNYESNINTDLLNKYNSLVSKYSKYRDDLQTIVTPIKGYPSLMNAYYNAIDLALYLESGLMPDVKMGETDAEEQGLLLEVSLPSLIAVTSLKSVSFATANSAILSMAKAIVNSHYKVEINHSELTNNNWSGIFIVTNNSDEEDTYTTGVISRTLTDWDEEFIKQKIEKMLNKENTDDLSISGLFEKEYDVFCEELKKYALKPLISFRDAAQACIDILIEQGVGNKDTWADMDDGADSNLYEKLYVPYYNKLIAIENEIKVREDEVNLINGVYVKRIDIDGNDISVLDVNGLKQDIEKIKVEIQNSLNFEKYLGTDLWLEFCAYRREDTYSNANYKSDGLDNAELFKKANEFIEVAENEIYKSSELQHSISTTLKNLLAIPKFKKLVQSFKVGNWIRVQVDDIVYKLRLLEYEIDYGDFDKIPVQFSDVTKIKNGVTDVQDVLSQASSMASSYDSIQRQAKQGDDAKNTISDWLANGLNSALVQIQNNNSEEITIDKNGILGRSYNDITDSYSSEQFKLTHNIFAYTSDNWKTVSAALGKHDYEYYDANLIKQKGTDYGLSSKFVTAGYINGSQIIGGEIVSSNYEKSKSGTYLNLIDGDFDFAGGKIVYDTKENTVTLSDVTIEWSNTNAPEVTVNDITGIETYLDQIEQLENQLDGRVQTFSQTNDPSISWSDTEKSEHSGDLWFNPDDGLTKRWNGSSWDIIEDSELKELAQSKAQVFVSTPTPPYYKGDLWVQGSSGDILHCVTTKLEGESFSQSDWAKSSKYTDDTKANEAYALADESKGIAENAEIIGTELVNGLGFKKTELTDKYIISPVIAGGHLLIGDTAGTYAQITTDGLLQCANAEINGTIRGSDIIGGSISSLNYKEGEQGTYIDLQNGTFELGNGSMVYNGSYLTLSGVVINWASTNTPSISDIDELETSLNDANSLANAAQNLANEAQNLANSAQSAANDANTRAEQAETNAKTYADSVGTSAKTYADGVGVELNKSLTNAYQQYTDSKISNFDSYVAQYLGLNGGTIIGENFVVSPIIEGGYLNITNADNDSRVIIDPNNMTGNGYIFQVHNGEQVTVGVNKDGNAIFSGTISGSQINGSTFTSIDKYNRSIVITDGASNYYWNDILVGSIYAGDDLFSIGSLGAFDMSLYSDNHLLIGFASNNITSGITTPSIFIGDGEKDIYINGNIYIDGVDLETYIKNLQNS